MAAREDGRAFSDELVLDDEITAEQDALGQTSGEYTVRGRRLGGIPTASGGWRSESSSEGDQR